VANGLFYVDILARLAGPNRLQSVPMIRRANHYSIDVFALQQLLVIADLVDFDAILFFNVSCPFIQNGGVNIAKRHETRSIGSHDIPNEALASTVETDYRAADVAVGTPLAPG